MMHIFSEVSIFQTFYMRPPILCTVSCLIQRLFLGKKEKKSCFSRGRRKGGGTRQMGSGKVEGTIFGRENENNFQRFIPLMTRSA